MNSTKSEIFISIGLIILSLALLDPFMVIIPGSMVMVVMVILAGLFIAFTAFVWREQVRDEREERIRMQAGRLSWLAGASILIAGVLSEGLISHKVDTWLIIALVGMILTKLFFLWYSEKNY